MAGAPHGAAHSLARTRQKSIARPLMPRAISQKTSSPQTCDRCTIQLSYAIASPSRCRFMSTRMDRTGQRSSRNPFRGHALSPRGIRSISSLTANLCPYGRYGHFGRARTRRRFLMGKTIWRRSLKHISLAIIASSESLMLLTLFCR